METNGRALASVHGLGVLLMQKGLVEEALPLAREAFDGRARLLGPDHLDTLESQGRVALILQARRTMLHHVQPRGTKLHHVDNTLHHVHSTSHHVAPRCTWWTAR